ncbi:MAG: toll/interleukin-1 receptor domain-containing protein [Candidatus Thermoplasmatota archaeon]
MADKFLVFVSHSAKDKHQLELIRGAIRGTGARPYVAEENVTPGAKLSTKIRNKIEECDVFLLILTENSAASAYVNQEIGYALGLEKFVLPIVIGDTCPQNLCSDIEYIRIDPERPSSSIRTVRAIIKAKKNETELEQLVKIGALTLGTIAWLKYGPQIKETASRWWQNLNRPLP